METWSCEELKPPKPRAARSKKQEARRSGTALRARKGKQRQDGSGGRDRPVEFATEVEGYPRKPGRRGRNLLRRHRQPQAPCDLRGLGEGDLVTLVAILEAPCGAAVAAPARPLTDDLVRVALLCIHLAVRIRVGALAMLLEIHEVPL